MKDLTVMNFHRPIIKLAVQKLGRNLTKQEKIFITSRGGFLALEMIHDTVKTEAKEYVEKYLNSE